MLRMPYTNAPWGFFYEIKTDDYRIIDLTHKLPIAKCQISETEGKYASELSKANARLIASAPDLYLSIIELLSAYTTSSTNRCKQLSACERAWSAINKAKFGKAQGQE